jgi:hypothetical protein
MLVDKADFGIPKDKWEAAKREARETMVECARRKGTIAYSALAGQIRSMRFQAHEKPFFHFLGEISSDEDAAGRGMLTAIVVHKHGDMKPGPGFLKLAEELGRDVRDVDACWVNELSRVYAAWSRSSN